MPRVGRELPYLAVVATWPFLFLWAYVAGYVLPGNDFDVLYYNYKLYLLAFLAQGHFPLWSFGEAAGFPFYSSPFTQSFYPLNVVYLLHYVVLGGLTPWDYTMYTILAFSIFGLGVYAWLRAHAIAPAVACAATLIATVSLKVTELLRFPNAAHAAAWLPWLLFGVALATDRRRLAAAAWVIAASLLLLVTAGYPYYLVYAAFLVAPYALAMASPAVRLTLGRVSQAESSALAVVATAGGAATAAALLVSPWLLHMRALMAQTVDRATPNLAFARLGQSGPLEALGSWVFPPAAQTEGWYYFGIVATVLVVAHLVSAAGGQSRVPRARTFAVLVGAWLLIIEYFTWGTDSALFTWAWHRTPVLNQMRVWNRMHIILVPVVTLVLARGLVQLLEFLRAVREGAWREQRGFAVVLAAVCAVVLAAQAYLLQHRVFSYYWTFYFKHGGSVAGQPWPIRLAAGYDERLFLAATLAVIALLVALTLGARRRLVGSTTALVASVALAGADVYVVSNFQWPVAPYAYVRQPVSVDWLLRDGVFMPRLLGQATVDPVGHATTVGLLENWGFMRHARVVHARFERNGMARPGTHPAEVAAATRFFGADLAARRLFVTGRVDHASMAAFMADADAAETQGASVRLLDYDGDVLRVAVTAPQPSWLTFVDNWDPDWAAAVDGTPVPITRPFSSYKAVPIHAGDSEVSFSYEPRWFPRAVQEP